MSTLEEGISKLEVSRTRWHLRFIIRNSLFGILPFCKFFAERVRNAAMIIFEETERSHTTPETVLRMGISDDIEFRLRWNHAWRSIGEEGEPAENIEGAEDLRWSFKLRVTDQNCWQPESALDIRATAPTGGSAWSTERVEFGLNYSRVATCSTRPLISLGRRDDRRWYSPDFCCF